MNNQLLAYLSIRTQVLRSQQELGTVATLQVLARIIEEIGQAVEVDSKIAK